MRMSRIGFDPNQAATAHRLLSESQGRVALILVPSNTALATLSNDPNPVLGAGLNLPQNGYPIILDSDCVGDIVTKEWYVIYSVAGGNMSFVEVFG